MRNRAITAVCLTIAAPALASVLAGCGQHPSAASGGPSASTTTSHVLRSPHVTAGAPAPSARPVSTPGRKAAASSSPAAAASQGSALPAEGLYVDAADGTPHYVLALTRSGSAAIRGSVSYLYQDGRIDTIGPYTATLSTGGKLTVAFSNGRTLVGTYQSADLTLTGCASVLTLATHPGDCKFTYHGHAP